MSHLISSGEILGTFTRDEQEFEVCAEGEATYDENTSRLTMELDSFLRRVELRQPEERLLVDWLPRRQIVKETVARAEASTLARDIFRRWAGKVRQSVPVPIHHY